MALDPQLAGLLAFLEQAGYPPMSEGSPADARRGFRALAVDMVKPEDVVPVGSVEELTVEDRVARLYRPLSAGPVPTLLFLHGGGFVIGDLDTHDQTCRRICRGADVAVLSVDYRLAPEQPFPAGLDDARAAVRWAAGELSSLGGAPLLAVGGDSAGGNLSAVVAQEQPDLVQAQLLIYPATDVAGDYPSRVENASGYFLDLPTMEWFFHHYVATVEGLEPDDPRISPLHGPLAGVAPAVVATAEFDPLRDEGEAYADALAEAGVRVEKVRYDGMIHGFADMGPISPAAAAATDDLIGRFRKLLSDL